MSALEDIVFDLLDEIALKRYDALVSRCAASRLSAGDIERVVIDYGRTVVRPPRADYTGLSTVRLSGASSPTWSVAAPLWTSEEGRSDLTLELTISLTEAGMDVQLDDLHVL